MKILLISPSYLPRIGGLENFVGDLAQFFITNGHEVKIITQKYLRRLKRAEVIDGIEVTRYLFFDPKPPVMKIRSIVAYAFTLLWAPVNLLKFILFVRKFRPDIINYQFAGASTFFILIYLYFFNNMCIVSLHGADVRSVPFESKASKFLFERILKKADAVTANSYYLLREALRKAPLIKRKAKVIYSAINFEELKNVEPPYRHSGNYMLAAGRFVEKKGFDILIKAFALALQEYRSTDLIIAGDGPQRKYLENLKEELGLNNRVVFYGWANRKRLVQLLKGCEFFVLPSRDEPFGIVILEALACKKPVIATCSGGPQEIIEDGVNGLLVEKGNPYALAEAMKKLFKDSELRQKITCNLEHALEKFDIARVGEEYLKIFKK